MRNEFGGEYTIFDYRFQDDGNNSLTKHLIIKLADMIIVSERSARSFVRLVCYA